MQVGEISNMNEEKINLFWRLAEDGNSKRDAGNLATLKIEGLMDDTGITDLELSTLKICGVDRRGLLGLWGGQQRL